MDHPSAETTASAKVSARTDGLLSVLVGRALAALDDPGAALGAVTTALVELGLADRVSVTVRTLEGLRTYAATDEVALAADVLQHDLREGPGFGDRASDDLLTSGDVRLDPRWPCWGPHVAATGLRALLSASFRTVGGWPGALTFSYEHRAVTAGDTEAARTAQGLVAVLLGNVQHEENLWVAVDARHRIGQAQGILMERFDIDTDRAFLVLRRLSQQLNVKLSRVAETITDTGGIPNSAADIVPAPRGHA